MPEGEVASPVITDNRDGTVQVQFAPNVEGLHELQVCYNGEHVQGKGPPVVGLDKQNYEKIVCSRVIYSFIH